jgi:hypothetical protein
VRLRQQLDKLTTAADAKGIQQLAELVGATWWSRVSKLRQDWLGDDIKSASQYATVYERLAKEAGSEEPQRLLEWASQKTSSKASLRLYRAAIKWGVTQGHKEALQGALREADRMNAKARKASKGAKWGGDVASVYSGIVYEETLAPIAAALDSLTALFEDEKATKKPTGQKCERSHGQRSKLNKLPDDWQARMLARMRKGRGKQPGKWATHAEASVLVGARPCELEKLTFYREGPLLVVTVQGAKLGKVSVPKKNGDRMIVSTGRKEREFCFDLSLLTGPAREAALQLYAKAPANGGVLTLGDADGFASAWRGAAGREFGKKLAPAAYANRHQFASELKSRAGANPEGDPAKLATLRHQIAAALGHASTATQKVYGRPAHSKLQGLEGLVSVTATGAAREPRPPAPPGAKSKAKAKSVSKTKPIFGAPKP